MNDRPKSSRSEIARIREVSDMLCTGHASLRDRFQRRALLLDFSIFAISIWLVSLAFVEPRINLSLTPFNLDPPLWSGLLAILALLLSVLQIKVDWKGRSDAHRRSLEVYSEVKREAGYLLASCAEPDEDSCQRIFSRYDLASSVGIAIPESEFLTQKRRHKLKISLSKYLDERPSASIPLTRLKLWLRDNVRR